MEANSKAIESSQDGIHPRLEEVVKKHLKHSFNKPLHKFSETVFNEVSAAAAESGKPLVLDSGCGTGESTIALAEMHPDCFVIGIDKSKHRVTKQENLRGDNFLIAQADVIDFWRQAADVGWSLKKHYLLYPNPWPKPEHLKRRWHGHPVFPYILKLGGEIELRTNWGTYAEEFKLAAELSGHNAELTSLNRGTLLSHFEQKYSKSGHQLFCIKFNPDFDI